MTKKNLKPFTRRAIKAKSPRWATIMFRIVFLTTTGAVGYIASTNLFDLNTKYEITLLLKLIIDPVVWSLSKMFGVELKEDSKQ